VNVKRTYLPNSYLTPLFHAGRQPAGLYTVVGSRALLFRIFISSVTK